MFIVSVNRYRQPFAYRPLLMSSSPIIHTSPHNLLFLFHFVLFSFPSPSAFIHSFPLNLSLLLPPLCSFSSLLSSSPFSLPPYPFILSLFVLLLFDRFLPSSPSSSLFLTFSIILSFFPYSLPSLFLSPVSSPSSYYLPFLHLFYSFVDLFFIPIIINNNISQEEEKPIRKIRRSKQKTKKNKTNSQSNTTNQQKNKSKIKIQ